MVAFTSNWFTLEYGCSTAADFAPPLSALSFYPLPGHVRQPRPTLMHAGYDDSPFDYLGNASLFSQAQTYFSSICNQGSCIGVYPSKDLTANKSGPIAASELQLDTHFTTFDPDDVQLKWVQDAIYHIFTIDEQQ